MFLHAVKSAVKRAVFGDTLLPRDFTLGLVEPQSEISVWLHRASHAPLDVTGRYAMACSDPFTVCIALDAPALPGTLKFCECREPRRVLGEIELNPSAGVGQGSPDLVFYEATGAALHCISPRHLWAHRLINRQSKNSGADMSALARRALIVNFIRPHPVVLVSLIGENGGTIFPMNLTGDLGPGRLGLALQIANQPGRLVEAARRIAVSSVPLPHAHHAYELSKSHSRQSLDWAELPFPTMPSTTWQIPVPQFDLRVREMEIEQVHRTGRHTFFVARAVSDERHSDAPALHTIHGYYQAWRCKGRPAELAASLTADRSHKGRY